MSSDFNYYESRATMFENIFKISIFTIFSDITYETLLRRESFQTKKKTFLFNSMLIYFLLFNR